MMSAARMLIFVLSIPLNSAAAGELRVMVTDSETGRAVAGAVVEFEGGAGPLLTGPDGVVSVEAGEKPCVLNVSKDGYAGESVVVEPSMTQVEVLLTPSKYRETQVLGSEWAYGIGAGQAGGRAMTGKEAERLPLVDNDPFRSVHVFPGVVADDYSARFELRGGESDEVAVRLDGMELFEPFHLPDFGGSLSFIDLSVVRSADLYTGGFPARFGEKMSGVFDIKAREGGEEYSGRAGIDILSVYGDASGPMPNGSFLVAARRGYIDFLLDLRGSDVSFRPEYLDGYGKFKTVIGDRATLYSNFLVGYDHNKADEDGVKRDLRSNYTNGIFWEKLSIGREDRASADLFAFYGFALRRKYEGMGGTDDRDLNYGGVKAEAGIRLFEGNNFFAGAEARYSGASYAYRPPNDPATWMLDYDSTGFDGWVYAEDEWQPVEGVLLAAGGRLFYRNYPSAAYLGPRLRIEYCPFGWLKLKAAWGVYHQPVTLLNVPVEDGAGEVRPAEVAVHQVAGVEVRPSESVFAGVEAYRKDMKNLVGRILDYARETKVLDRPDRGWAEGIEVYAAWRPVARLRLQAGYSLAVARERDMNEGWIYRGKDRRHSANAQVDWQIGRGFSLNAFFRFYTGMPYTPELYEKEAGTLSQRYGPLNSERLPAFHSLDARLTKEWSFETWKLSAYLQVLNAYYSKNVEEYAWEEVFDPQSGEVTGYSRRPEYFFPIIPLLGVMGEI